MKTRTCFILALFLGASLLTAAQAEQATLKSISLQKTETELVAVIECEGEFAYQTFEMSDPGRLVVEFTPVTKVLTEAAYNASAFGVSTVRTAQFQPQVARVVFDAPGKFPLYKISQSLNKVTVTFWQIETQGAEPAAPPAAEPAVEPAGQAAAPAAAADLKGLTFEMVNDQLKVSILTEGPAALKDVRLAQPNRLLAVFSPIEKVSAPPYVDINRSGVKRATIEKQDDRTYQVVFTLDGKQPSYKVDQYPNLIEILFKQEIPAKPAGGRRAATQPAQTAVREPSSIRTFPNTQFGILAGSYGVASQAFSDVYGSAGLIFGGELTKFLVTTDKLSFGLSATFRYFSKDGAATYTNDPTTLTLMPVSLTALATLSSGNLAPFLGVGGDFFNYKEKSDVHEVSGSTMGFHVQGGFYYRFPGFDFLAAKFYAKFTTATATQDTVDIKLGGTELGVSLNLCFDFPKK